MVKKNMVKYGKTMVKHGKTMVKHGKTMVKHGKTSKNHGLFRNSLIDDLYAPGAAWLSSLLVDINMYQPINTLQRYL